MAAEEKRSQPPPAIESARGWAAELDAVAERPGKRPARSSGPWRRAGRHLRGRPGAAERKSGRQLAERAGGGRPGGVRHPLSRAGRDPDAARDELTAYVAEHPGRPDGAPTVGGAGSLKEGTRSAGVRRRYGGTAGRVEGCQIGVPPAHAAPAGRASPDRELYPPEGRVGGAGRPAAAGAPESARSAPKAAPARRMIGRAPDAGGPAARAAAGAAYGPDCEFRAAPGRRGPGCAVGVRGDRAACAGSRQARAAGLPAGAPAEARRRPRCCDGSEGPRASDRAAHPLDGPEPEGYAGWPPVRRDGDDPKELAHSLCGGPPGTAPEQSAAAAGTRRAIEEGFALAEGGCGLDPYGVRSGAGWYRHVTPSPSARALPAVTRSGAAGPRRRPWGGPRLIAPAAPEVRRLLLELAREGLAPAGRTPARSGWRRGHQATARRGHWKKRLAKPPR